MTCNKPLRGLRVPALAGLLILIGACATTEAPQPDTATVAGVAPSANVVVKPQRPAKIETPSEYDFIIEESVRIPGSAGAQYDQAMGHLANGRLTEGITLLESLVAETPELTAPHVDLGVAYVNAGRMQEAEERLQHALALTPGHPVAANELGIVYRRTGRFELARQSFQTALATFPNYHVAQRNLGVLCDVFLNDLDCALEHYRAYRHAYPEEREIELWIVDAQRRLAMEGGS